MPYQTRVAVINAVRDTQIQKIKDISTMIGTLTDKKLLLEGKPTENTKVTFELPPEVKPYAE